MDPAPELLYPRIHHAPQSGYLHARDRQVMARRKADHAADAGFALGDQQALLLEPLHGRSGFEGGEIVIEDEGCSVRGIAYTGGARIAGAEIALGSYSGGLREPVFHLPLPRPMVRWGETSSHSRVSGL